MVKQEYHNLIVSLYLLPASELSGRGLRSPPVSGLTRSVRGLPCCSQGTTEPLSEMTSFPWINPHSRRTWWLTTPKRFVPVYSVSVLLAIETERA